MRKWLYFFFALAGVLILSGFRLDNSIIPKEEILSGGVPKDRVLGIEVDGDAKAYPLVQIGSIQGGLEDTVCGKSLRIEVNSKLELFYA